MASGKGKTRSLGRGLSALMADVASADTEGQPADSPRDHDILVPIEKIAPNPDQPRRNFDKESLEDLANSIAEKGVIQPLIVRPRGDGYEIIAGERRWRAAQRAKLHELPVLVRDFSDAEVLEIAIIENVQRADLNPVEEAAGYRQLMDRFGHTQEQLSRALGKSRSHIANLLRLLQLPDEVQGYLKDGRLSAGHARALITADDPAALARKVIRDGMSVRATEALAKTGVKPKTPGTKGAARQSEKDADTRALEDDLSAQLGMKVSVDHAQGRESGQLVIRYKSFEQLDDLCRLLSSNC